MTQVLSTLLAFLTIALIACNNQEPTIELATASADEETTAEVQTQQTKEPHRYGGWYCPDNFGFEPVDIQQLSTVPAIEDRLPTEEELRNNMSLIKVDTEMYPDARALDMDLPRLGKTYVNSSGMEELIIVIQAIVVQEDTVVGYRFPSGGNGSGWLSDVTLFEQDEVDAMGTQPFFYTRKEVKAKTEEIWNAFTQTEHAASLGSKFGEEAFFAADWNDDGYTFLSSSSEGENARGFVGNHFGNAYLQIDYDRNGFHYSEKIMISEDSESGTSDLYVANGPYPQDFDQQNANWTSWVEDLIAKSEK